MSNLTTSCFIIKNIFLFARNHPSLKMIGQSKISTFFSPRNNKRTADTGFDQNTPPKKSKTSDEQDNVTTKTLSPEQKQKMEANKLKAITKLNAQKSKDIEDTSSPEKQTKESTEPLSPEQKEKIKENKLKALAKLNALKSSGIAVGIGESWNNALQSEFTKPYFVELSKFVERERASGTVYPPPHQVFTWTHLSDIDQVKVVILGQDPYHGPGQAHGLCFSVQKGIKPPPSLQNMYKELASDIDGFKHPGHGTLNGWAEQGVLLLNACLTVRAHNANSHAGKGWEKFTDVVISWFNKHKNGIVFMLWGSYAQKKGACIDKKRHHILKAVHPSPLSAHRGFFGCKHFSQCNSLLKDQGKKQIDWTRLPPE